MSDNDHPEKHPPRRRKRLLFFILFSGLLCVAWLSYFIATFDLNNYRTQLAARLSESSGLPITLGSINFELHDIALALHVKEVQVGGPDNHLDMRIPDLWFDLQWLGLLGGELNFLNVTLNEPTIHYDPGRVPDDQRHRKSDLSAFAATRIKGLVLTDGTLLINPDPARHPEPLQIHQLNMDASDIGMAREAAVDLSGVFQYAANRPGSPFRLKGTFSMPATTQQGGIPNFELDFAIDRMQGAEALSVLAPQLPAELLQGEANLTLYARGAEDRHVDLRMTLDSENFAINPGDLYQQPVSVKEVIASGRWQRTGEQQVLDEVIIQLDGGRLSGAVFWDHASSVPNRVQLTRGSLPLPLLERWLPDKTLPDAIAPFIAGWKNGLGNLWLEQGVLIRERNKAVDTWQLRSLGVSAQGLSWDLPKSHKMHIQDLKIDFTAPTWRFIRAQAALDNTPFKLTGTITSAASSPTMVELDLASELALPEILESWGLTYEQLAISGKLPVAGQLHGPSTALKLDLQADLGDLHLAYAPYLKLNPAEGDRLVFNGTLQGQHLNLDHAKLEWASLESNVHGHIALGAPQDSAFEIQLAIPDLAMLPEVAEKLKGLQLGGRAELTIRQRGLTDKVSRDITATVRDAEVGTGRLMADLNRINGRIKFTEQGLVTEQLRLHLGESPVRVKAALPDFKDPTLHLDVQASQVRADELIFYSDTSFLYDIDGHLVITADQVRLDAVKARLANGTVPEINGTIRTGPTPSVELDINAAYADIAEVIGLWSGGSEKAKALREDRRKKPDTRGVRPVVVIRAEVAEGNLYGMTFHQASGTIAPTADMLIIHPLDFHVGEGFCNAQVLVDFQDDGPPLLRISGHTEDVDAFEVYRELLDQKNILRGRLRGDFYLQGLIGARFLPSSFGHFNVEVHKGVLHKFQVLSKVFSLINVSQLFAFQLPDMDSKGMPFTQLTGHFSLEQGKLETDDLVVRSEAMNQAYQGSFNLVDKEVDLKMAIHPLGTVDKVVSKLPVAGWLLTGEDKVLLTAHFNIKGPVGNISVTPAPISSISDQTLGVLRRTLGLPFKLIKDPQILWGGDKPQKNDE